LLEGDGTNDYDDDDSSNGGSSSKIPFQMEFSHNRIMENHIKIQQAEFA